jgi:peptidoglycan/LPS O-acetylase OafA/YrhL
MTERDWSVIPRGQFGFIDLLRGPAALLVLYSHYVGIYLASHHQTYWLKEWVNALFVRPLVIVDQFGQLGVMVFFLISGFIITHVARSENVLRFGIRRVFRIYPGYWLIAIIVIAFGITGTGFQLSWLRNWADVARIATITNYLHAPQHLVLGVGWTLQIEVMYYAMIACAMPLIRRAPFWAMVVELAFVFLVIAHAHSFGDDWYLFAANVAYLPYLLIGQAIYFYWAGGLKGRWALLLGWMCYFAALFGIYRILTTFLEPSESRVLCLVLALGIFVWALNYGHQIGLMRIPKFFSDISYSLYLIHGPLGLLLLVKLHPLIGYGNAAVIATVASIAAAAAIHYDDERPCIRLGRRLSGHIRKQPSAEAESSAW